MLSTHTEILPPAADDYFEIIYQAAKIRDKSAIEAVLPFVSVDINISREGAPVSRLAAENNIPAVIFLRKNFRASLRWIIYGFGLQNNMDAIKRILFETVNDPLRYFELLKYACSGLGKGKHDQSAFIIIDQAKNPLQRKQLYQLFLTGMAENNALNALHFEMDDMPAIIYGFTLGNHKIQALAALRTVTNPELLKACLDAMVHGTSEIGEDPRELINMEASAPEVVNEVMLTEANAAARNGFADIAQNTALAFADVANIEIEFLALEYAESGNLAELQTLYTSATDENKFLLESAIARGLANGEHLGAFDTINMANNDHFRPLIPKIINSFISQNYSRMCNELLPLIENRAELNETLYNIVNIIKHQTFPAVNELLSTQILLQFSPPYRDPLANHWVAAYPEASLLARKLVLRTNSIEKIMADEPLFSIERAALINRAPYSYNLAFAGCNPQVITLMLQCQKLPSDLILALLPFITPLFPTDFENCRIYFNRHNFFYRLSPVEITGKPWHSSRRLNF